MIVTFGNICAEQTFRNFHSGHATPVRNDLLFLYIPACFSLDRAATLWHVAGFAFSIRTNLPTGLDGSEDCSKKRGATAPKLSEPFLFP